MSPRSATLVLFARTPVAGSVKTRLGTALSPDAAARLYRAFLTDAARVYTDPAWTPVLYADGDPDDPILGAIFGPPWRRERQADGNLGARLTEAFRAELARGAGAVLAVGSDHPALTRDSLRELLRAVERGRDAAVIPASDGGYCAIALSAGTDPEHLFRDIPWSSETTLSTTLERLRSRRLSVDVRAPGYDVDRPEDLDRLRADLALRNPAEDDYPTATAAALLELAGGPAA